MKKNGKKRPNKKKRQRLTLKTRKAGNKADVGLDVDHFDQIAISSAGQGAHGFEAQSRIRTANYTYIDRLGSSNLVLIGCQLLENHQQYVYPIAQRKSV